VDDRAFAARAVAISEASRSRVDRLRRELAEQQAAARVRGRGHLQRMVDLAGRATQEAMAAAEPDRATKRAPVGASPKRTPARDPGDESFSDRHWLH
jgi:hypothetical protein